LELLPTLDPRLQPRNKCILLGFNSIAIIPIHTTKGILGSLQLNDKAKNAFNKDTVNFLERVALSVGNVLMRMDVQNDLIESQTKLNAIFNNTHTGFFLLDKDFKIVSCNTSAKVLAKKAFQKDVFLNENFLQLIPNSRLSEVNNHLQMALTGVEIHYDVSYPQQNGTEVWFDKNYKPVFNDKQEVSGISLSITDFSKRKTAEYEKEILIKELSNKNNELMQFNYIVSHNLRSPVANLMGLCNLFKLNVLDDADKLKVIEQIGKASANMDAIIKDLNIILSARSAINTHKEKVNISELIEGLSHTLDAQIEETGCNIETNILPQANLIFTVKSYLESVLYNLINNAIKYRSPKRKLHIRISTHKKQDRFILEVTDNGQGIDMQKHGNYIFGLYKRFHPELEGKGLGLHISKTQVEALGGSIHVDSEVDKGSSFVVSLPVLTSNEP
jgi:PAS domain S-box-containing protein